MLNRARAHESPHDDRRSGLADAMAASPRILIAVAPSPRLAHPTRWGWPHWLAPEYKAGGHHSTHRPLEDYA